MKYILCSSVAPASKETPLLICKLKDSGEGAFVSARGQKPFTSAVAAVSWEFLHSSLGEVLAESWGEEASAEPFVTDYQWHLL